MQTSNSGEHVHVHARKHARPPLEYFVRCAQRDLALNIADVALQAGLRVALVDENEATKLAINPDNSKSNSKPSTDGSTSPKSNPVIVCVGIGRKQLERRAEQEGLVKWAREPSLFTGHPYRLEFSRDAQRIKGIAFKDYASSDFFSPCERVELLERVVERIITNETSTEHKHHHDRGHDDKNAIVNSKSNGVATDNAIEKEEHGSLLERLKVEGASSSGILAYGPLHPIGGDYASRHSLTAKDVLKSAVMRFRDGLAFSLTTRDDTNSIAKIRNFYGRYVFNMFMFMSTSCCNQEKCCFCFVIVYVARIRACLLVLKR
jgi:hypothetical protein